MIRLRDFFQTGQISDLCLGVSRLAVKHSLGAPDDFLNPALASQNSIWNEANAPIWWYGGIEFAFDTEFADSPHDHPLQSIQFKPYYLFLRQWPTPVQRWVFRSCHGPTRQLLAAALNRAGCMYQDTGLETLRYDTQAAKFTVIASQPQAISNSTDESFGTLVLKNGIQVRYAEDDSLIQIQIGADWMFHRQENVIEG